MSRQLYAKLNHIISLLEKLTDYVPEKLNSKVEVVLESKPKDSRNRVSDDTYKKYGPELVKRIFDTPEYNVALFASDLGISTDVIQRILKRLKEDHGFVMMEEGEVTLTDPQKAGEWLMSQRIIPESKSIDPYTQRQTAKVLEVLLQDDARKIGIVPKDLAEKLAMTRSTCERLVRIAVDLGLATKGAVGSQGGIIRIPPYQMFAAKRWVEETFNTIPDKETPNWDMRNVSDESFRKFGPEVVYALYGEVEGLKMTDIAQKVKVKDEMLRGIIMRLQKEGIEFVVSIEAPGQPKYVWVTNMQKADKWLEKNYFMPASRSNRNLSKSLS